MITCSLFWLDDFMRRPWDVPQGRFDLFVLIHELIGGGSNYHDYCRRAGLKPVAHDWPK
jgi:hypothetical protein